MKAKGFNKERGKKKGTKERALSYKENMEREKQNVKQIQHLENLNVLMCD